MGAMSIWHWLIVLGVAVLLFGGSGKISSIMRDVAVGIKGFKKGMAEDDEIEKPDDAKTIDNVVSSKSERSKAEQTKAG